MSNIQLKKIIESQESLALLSNMKFKAVKLFSISKFLEQCDAEIKKFNTVKNEKIKQYGTEKENDTYELDKENQTVFFDEINQLLELEIDIDVPEIVLEDFNDIEITPKQFLSLKWLIKGA